MLSLDLQIKIFEYLHHLSSKNYLKKINIIGSVNEYDFEKVPIAIRIELRCIYFLELKNISAVIYPPIYYHIFKKHIHDF